MFKGNIDVRLVIKHPTMSLDAITRELQLQCRHGHSVGEPRSTPTGDLLGGVWPETFWSYTTNISGRRDFISASVEFLKKFEGNADFFKAVRKEKGLVALYVHLNGCQNFGDVIKLEEIAFFISLGVEFGVELFP